VSYATGEPAGCLIIWTATIGGESVNLRFSGNGDYVSNISSSYSEGETYWGAEPEIEFDLMMANAGEELVLICRSLVGGFLVNTSVNIALTVPMDLTYTASGTFYGYTPVGGFNTWYVYVWLTIIDIDTSETEFEKNWWVILSPDGYVETGENIFSGEDPGGISVVISYSGAPISIAVTVAEQDVEKEYILSTVIGTYNGTTTATHTGIVHDINSEEIIASETETKSLFPGHCSGEMDFLQDEITIEEHL